MPWNVDKRLSPIHSDDRQYNVFADTDYTVYLDVENPGQYDFRWSRGDEPVYSNQLGGSLTNSYTIPGRELSTYGNTVYYTVEGPPYISPTKSGSDIF